MNLFIARLFYPETFPPLPFRGAAICGGLVVLIAAAVLFAWALS